MSIFTRKDTSFYYYDFVIGKQRYAGSTGRTTEREAKAFERELKAELRSKPKHEIKPGIVMTVDDATGRYNLEVGQNQKRPDKVFWSMCYLNEKLGPLTLISKIDNDAVARLVAGRRSEIAINKYAKLAKRVSASTVNRSVIEPLRKVLNRARDVWGQPVQKIHWKLHLLKEPKERIRELSEDEERRLWNALNPRHHELVFVTMRIGLRATEVVELPWSKIDWGNQTMSILGKGDKEVPVPMPKDVRELLWRIQNRHPERVFSWLDGDVWKPFTYSGVDTQLGRACARAGIKDFHFHDLRHTAATRLLRTTGNIKMVQKLLRHEDIKTTGRYAHVLDSDLRNALDAMSVHEVPTVVTTPTTLKVEK